MIEKSLAGTDRPYVVVQVRNYPDGLHVQGAGHEGNRSYGFAGTFKVGREVTAFVDEQERTLPSLAETGQKYVKALVRPRQTEIHFQIPNGPANRGYGLAFSIEREGEFWNWLAEMILAAQ